MTLSKLDRRLVLPAVFGLLFRKRAGNGVPLAVFFFTLSRSFSLCVAF